MPDEPNPGRFEGKIDTVVFLMFIGIFLALGLLILVERWFPQDGQIFQVVAGAVGLFGVIMPPRVDQNKKAPPFSPATGSASPVPPNNPAAPQDPQP